MSNPWIDFVRQNKGRGKTLKALSKEYRQFKQPSKKKTKSPHAKKQREKTKIVEARLNHQTKKTLEGEIMKIAQANAHDRPAMIQQFMATGADIDDLHELMIKCQEVDAQRAR